MAEVMLQNQTLHDFDISHNRIGLDGIMVMVKGLKENEELRRLKVCVRDCHCGGGVASW